MNSKSFLNQIAAALHKARLEAIMIGNAAAALHGAPVTTLDIDFMFRKTQNNLQKLKILARELDAYILKPYYPLSGLYRIINDEKELQIDFMSIIHGIKSFESLRSDSIEAVFGKYNLKVASLKNIIKSKRAAKRPRDRAVIDILEKTFYEKEKQKKRSN